MSADVLVAYGTKHGATVEIAACIAATLRDAGVDVELLPADHVRSIDPYGAVVLGSAVYMLRWRRDARRLLRQALDRPPERPVWLFSSGPLDRDAGRDDAKVVSAKVRSAVDRPGVIDHTVFGGRYPLEPSNLVERSMLKRAPSPGERDFRDWDAIEDWARGIARRLAQLSSAGRRGRGGGSQTRAVKSRLPGASRAGRSRAARCRGRPRATR
jgi:menaquinone-dependent protoporphyrinogen oxidase